MSQHENAQFWQPRHEYTLTLHVQRRSALMPELERYYAPLKDTGNVALTPDSLARDSIYGAYNVDFRHLGVSAGAVGETRQQFAGRVSRDSVEIELAPNATDAGLIVQGTRKGDSIAGRWQEEDGRTSGIFVLRHR